MGPVHRKGLPREGGLAREKVIATDGLFQEKGVAFVDAPVSGGVIGAEQGTLSVMAAGDRQAFDTVEPLLCRSAATSSVSARARAWAKP